MHDWLRTVDIDPATPGVHAAAGHADGRSSDRAHATRTGHESTKPNEDGDGTCRGKAREVVLVMCKHERTRKMCPFYADFSGSSSLLGICWVTTCCGFASDGTSDRTALRSIFSTNRALLAAR